MRNLVFERASIDSLDVSGSNNVYAGVLAATNDGTISNVTVANSTLKSGTISNREYYLGGLVAINSGTIIDSIVRRIRFTAGNNAVTQYVGGLAAKNNATIRNNSVPSISLTDFAASKAGSLVGWNATGGTVTGNSYIYIYGYNNGIGRNNGTASGNSEINPGI